MLLLVWLVELQLLSLLKLNQSETSTVIMKNCWTGWRLVNIDEARRATRQQDCLFYPLEAAMLFMVHVLAFLLCPVFTFHCPINSHFFD
eukprot:scaffold34580_cov61-Cyclotella_meneghiniana.AAC.4